MTYYISHSLVTEHMPGNLLIDVREALYNDLTLMRAIEHNIARAQFEPKDLFQNLEKVRERCVHWDNLLKSNRTTIVVDEYREYNSKAKHQETF